VCTRNEGEGMMSDSHSDALIFFGAAGDLAHKKIFPSLQAMLKRGHLEVPVIRVAKSGWNLDQFRARARDSLEKHGGLLHCHSAGAVRARQAAPWEAS
jgi:glucose-6-phosphate 1-dehydrogenase